MSENTPVATLEELTALRKSSKFALLLAAALVLSSFVAIHLYKKINDAPSDEALREWLVNSDALPAYTEIDSLAKTVETEGFRTTKVKVKVTLKLSEPLYEMITVDEYLAKNGGISMSNFDEIAKLQQGAWAARAQGIAPDFGTSSKNFLNSVLLTEIRRPRQTPSSATSSEIHIEESGTVDKLQKFEITASVLATRKPIGWQMELRKNLKDALAKHGMPLRQAEKEAAEKKKSLLRLNVPMQEAPLRKLLADAPAALSKLRSVRIDYEKEQAEVERARKEIETARLQKEMEARRQREIADAPRLRLEAEIARLEKKQKTLAEQEQATKRRETTIQTKQRLLGYRDKWINLLMGIKSWEGYYVAPSGKRQYVKISFAGSTLKDGGNQYTTVANPFAGSTYFMAPLALAADFQADITVDGKPAKRRCSVELIIADIETAVLEIYFGGDANQSMSDDSIFEANIIASCQITDDYLLGKNNARSYTYFGYNDPRNKELGRGTLVLARSDKVDALIWRPATEASRAETAAAAQEVPRRQAAPEAGGLRKESATSLEPAVIKDELARLGAAEKASLELETKLRQKEKPQQTWERLFGYGEKFVSMLTLAKTWDGYYITPSGKRQDLKISFGTINRKKCAPPYVDNLAENYVYTTGSSFYKMRGVTYADMRVSINVGGRGGSFNAGLYVINADTAILRMYIRGNGEPTADDSLFASIVTGACVITDKYLLGEKNVRAYIYISRDNKGNKDLGRGTLVFARSAGGDDRL